MADLTVILVLAGIGMTTGFLGASFVMARVTRRLEDEFCVRLALLEDHEFAEFRDRFVEVERPRLDAQRKRGKQLLRGDPS